MCRERAGWQVRPFFMRALCGAEEVKVTRVKLPRV